MRIQYTYRISGNERVGWQVHTKPLLFPFWRRIGPVYKDIERAKNCMVVHAEMRTGVETPDLEFNSTSV